MNPKMNSPITLVLLDRLNRKVFEFMKFYHECAELTVIHRDEKTYVYQHQTEFSSDKIFFKEAKQILDLNEVKGTVELKADLQLDARDLQEVLALLQFNEISLLRAMTIIQDWTLGHKPLSSDLPVKSEDNPLISSDQCAMDVLREIREDIIKRREQNAIDAAFLASFVDRYHISLNIELANEMRAIIERLTADAHGKPVPQELKGPWSFKVGDPRLPKFSVIQEGTTEEFVFRANSDGSLTPEMKGAGARVEHMAGIGKVVVMPIKPMFDGPVLGKEMKWVPVDALRELEAAMELAMRQFSDSVKGALQKFHETP